MMDQEWSLRMISTLDAWKLMSERVEFEILIVWKVGRLIY
jgi:hypothetical protein